MARTFGDFVAHQVSRCEALPSGHNYTYSEAAQTEICDWLEGRGGERWDAEKQSDLMWLQDSMGARKVKAVIDEIMEGDKTPTIGDVRSAWERLHGTHKPVNYDCTECGGSGFELVVALNGAEGARACSRGCAVPAPRYEAEKAIIDADANTAFAAAFGADLAAKLAKSIVPGILPPIQKPITPEDIANAERFKL